MNLQPLGWDLQVEVVCDVMPGGVTVPSGDVWAGIAGVVGRGLRRSGVKRPLNWSLEGGVGKISICAVVRRHVAWIDGLQICWIRS